MSKINKAIIQIKGVSKGYGKTQVLNNINLDIRAGEFVVLIGESGCGKTTLLKLMNGLLAKDEGEIYIQGKRIEDMDGVELKRNMGYVIQQIGLFPHLTVEDNLNYVLSLKGISKEKRQRRAKELIELIGLDTGFLKRYPRELSGGQRQRVGIGRALASDPPIILMDEPLGAVDALCRQELQEELKDLFNRLGKTVVFVTHDLREAFKLGSKIVLLGQGEIIHNGTKESFMNQPKEYIRKFMGKHQFADYLESVPIKDFIVKGAFMNSDHKDSLKKLGKVQAIKESASVLEGLQMMYNKGHKSLQIVNKQGQSIGKMEGFHFTPAKNNTELLS